MSAIFSLAWGCHGAHAAWTIWHDWTTRRRKLFQLLPDWSWAKSIRSAAAASGGALMTQSAKGLSAARGTIKVHHRRAWTWRGWSQRRKRGSKDAVRWQFVARLVELCCDKNRINGTDNEKMHSWPRGGERRVGLNRWRGLQPRHDHGQSARHCTKPWGSSW